VSIRGKKNGKNGGNPQITNKMKVWKGEDRNASSHPPWHGWGENKGETATMRTWGKIKKNGGEKQGKKKKPVP